MNDIKCFRRVCDLIPYPVDFNTLFYDYIINSERVKLLDNDKNFIVLKKITDEIYLLLEKITENKSYSLFFDWYSKSENKTLSNLIDVLLRRYGTESYTYNDITFKSLAYEGVQNIMNIIYARFYNKWNSLYELSLAKYDALNPYTMDITDNKVDSFKSNITNNKNSKNEVNNQSSADVNSRNDSFLYSFNSDSAQPTNVDSTENSSKGFDNTNTNSEQTSVTDYDRSDNSARTVTRNGNIGNITKQDLIFKEREVLEYQIINTIFSDLDSVLTRSKYI